MSLEIYYGNTGSGKSAVQTYVCARNLEEDNYKNIYSNYPIYLPTNIFDEMLILPYSKIYNDVIAFDDVYSYSIINKNILKNILIFCANAKRKTDSLIMLTAQDTNAFSAEFRRLADKMYKFNKKWNYMNTEEYGLMPLIMFEKIRKKRKKEKKDELHVIYLEVNGKEVKETDKYTREEIGNVKFVISKKYLQLYDTYYKVKMITSFALERMLIGALKNKKFSKEDKEMYLDMFCHNKAEKKTLHEEYVF